jgi:hypothetical protein
MMQTESISRRTQSTAQGLSQVPDSTSGEVFLEREFLLDRFSLRAQFDWKVARHGVPPAVMYTHAAAAVPAVFRSRSEQVFTRDAIIEFLSQLRKVAARRLQTRHTSTPQIAVFPRGHHTWIEQDPSVAPWRYMYFAGPRRGGTSIGAVLSMREAVLPWFPWLTQMRTVSLRAGSNDLILYRSVATQSLLCEPSGTELEEQTVVLSGWLW